MNGTPNDQSNELEADEFAPTTSDFTISPEPATTDFDNDTDVVTTVNRVTPSWKKVDLSTCAADPGSVLNRHCQLILDEPELLGQVTVFDPNHVYVTAAAEQALRTECLTAAWLVSQFGAWFAEQLLKRAKKGKFAGLLIMHREASTFHYVAEKCSVPLIVTATTEPGQNGPVRLTLITLQHEVNLPRPCASLNGANQS